MHPPPQSTVRQPGHYCFWYARGQPWSSQARRKAARGTRHRRANKGTPLHACDVVDSKLHARASGTSIAGCCGRTTRRFLQASKAAAARLPSKGVSRGPDSNTPKCLRLSGLASTEMPGAATTTTTTIPTRRRAKVYWHLVCGHVSASSASHHTKHATSTAYLGTQRKHGRAHGPTIHARGSELSFCVSCEEVPLFKPCAQQHEHN